MAYIAPPMSPAEETARSALSAAHKQFNEILSKLSMPVDTYVKLHELARSIERTSSEARAELIWSVRNETRSVAHRATRPACDACGNGAAYDANGSPVECVRCGGAA